MNFDFSNVDELLKKAQDENLYKKLLLQLQKDFGLANIHVDITSSVLPEELKSVLLEKVYVLIMERFSEHLNLLYIVDVPEKAFKEIHRTLKPGGAHIFSVPIQSVTTRPDTSEAKNYMASNLIFVWCIVKDPSLGRSPVTRIQNCYV